MKIFDPSARQPNTDAKPLLADTHATKALIEKTLLEAEKQLNGEENVVRSVGDTANKALSIFDADPTGFVNVVLFMVRGVLSTIQKVQGNKAQIQYIGKRIEALLPTLERLKRDPRNSRDMRPALVAFKDCIEECNNEIFAYSQRHWFKQILLATVNQEAFRQLITRLNDSIRQLDLSLNVDTNALLHEMSRCVMQDKTEIMTEMPRIIKLEEESRRELSSMRQGIQKFSMEQNEFHVALGQQLEALSLEVVKKLELNAADQRALLEKQYEHLNKRFSELHASVITNKKPPIPETLLIPFYDIDVNIVLSKARSGVIYQGEWAGKPVVVKSMGSKLTEEGYKHFLKEVETMAHLRHPNIVLVYGACLDPEAYIIMEYVQYGSLPQYLVEKSPSLAQRAVVAADLGSALYYLHHLRKMIHRDLNPGSVLIDAQGHAKLADFGLAKVLNNGVMSTVLNIFDKASRNNENHWLAPELYQRDTVPTTDSDIYGLGLMLYYLFTGESLFADIPENQLSTAIIQGANRAKIDTKVPQDYCAIIQACLHINPNLRPDAREVSRQLVALQANYPVQAELKGSPKKLISQRQFSPEEVYKEGLIHAQAGRNKEAFSCYYRAAKGGYFRAQTELGMAFIQGAGCEENKQRGLKWLMRAANQKHGRAQFNLAQFFECEVGFQDTEQALFWYRRAAAQRIPGAKEKVAELQLELSGSVATKSY